MPKLKVYEYEKCSTCRKALKFLDAKGVAYEKIPIAEKPPTTGELKRMLEAQGGNLKKLFNTSGLQYRELKMSEKLPGMSAEEALRLLSSNGMLVKRPFALGEKFAAVGFDEKQWKRCL
jgi:arsenate reductase